MNSETREMEIRTNILIVDDRAENLVALDLVLEPLAQNVVTARSGDEALRCLLDQDFAVILLDVLMPGLDGFETASLIRQRAKTRHIPIIFLTAVSLQDDYVARGYTIGAVDYIAKPFHPDILRAKVAVFVELYRKNEQVRHQGELLRLAERRDRERALDEVRRASEKRYQELAESMPQIVWTASPDGRTTYWNRRWYDYTATTPTELDGEEWRRAIHLDDLGPMLRAWQRAREERRDFELAVRFRRGRDAAYRFHLVRAVAMLDALGEVSEWVGTSTDIHDRVRAEQGLQFLADASKLLSESLEHRSTLTLVGKLAAENIADWCAIDLVEPGGISRVVLSSARPERTAEVTNALEHGGGMVPAFFRAPTLPLPFAEASLLDAEASVLRLDAGAPLRIETWIRAPLHVRGEVIGELRLAIADSGRRFGPVDLALAEDLARRISTSIDNSRLFEAAQRERVALEAAARVKDEFLAVLSHELRTPLNATLGWAQMLKSGKLDRKSFGIAVETIERSARTQARLIEDLLDVSRIVTGKLRLQLSDVDVAEVVRAALETVQPAADAKPVRLDVAIEPGLPKVRGDAARLQQIAWNLLANAIKFTRAGDEIRVRLTRESGFITLVVEDDGPGIDPDFLPFVFDRFSQANSSMTRTHGGLGLGLSIVRHLAELHGGKCRAENGGPGRGARLVVDLPDGSAQKSAVASRPVVATDPTEDPPELAGVQVLVVEDVADGRALFQAMLEQCGALVRTAADAPEALALLDQKRPDILVSDIGLPGMNGYDLMRQIRTREAAGDIEALPALALTAYASEADRKNCLAAGFSTHVTKPVDGKALVRAIAMLVRRPDTA